MDARNSTPRIRILGIPMPIGRTVNQFHQISILTSSFSARARTNSFRSAALHGAESCCEQSAKKSASARATPYTSHANAAASISHLHVVRSIRYVINGLINVASPATTTTAPTKQVRQPRTDGRGTRRGRSFLISAIM